jgi:signal transduction histidine kinase
MTDLLQRLGSRQQPLLLGAGFAILLIIVIASAWMSQRARTDAKWQTHTLQVTNLLSELLLLVRRAESAQRGYLLTGNFAGYLSDYRTAADQVMSSFAEVKVATADNPGRQAELAALEPVLRSKLDELTESIRLHDAGDRAGVLALETGQGRSLTEDIRARVERIKADEERLLRLRSEEFDQSSRLLLLVTLCGVLVVIGLAAVAIILARRSRSALESAYGALEAANAGLEERVAARTADLSEANDEIQRFAYIVGHDLRAPLVNIMGFTSELETLRNDVMDRLASLREAAGGEPDSDKTLQEDFTEALGFIKAATAKMDRLINAILKLSREGRRDFRPERVDMSALLDGIAASLAHQAEAAGATIAIGRLPPAISDRVALEQVFSNLLDNALKYLRADEPGRIEVKGRAVPNGLVYEVSDNGRGIDPQDRERVFELFRRAGAQDRPGEGIGLAHVRALVRRLGGTIVLASQSGHGSTFTVTLPTRFIDEQERKAA